MFLQKILDVLSVRFIGRHSMCRFVALAVYLLFCAIAAIWLKLYVWAKPTRSAGRGKRDLEFDTVVGKHPIQSLPRVP